MAVGQPRYNKEEFAQRGDHWYDTEISQKVEAGNHGNIVAIASAPLEDYRHRNGSI